MSEKYRYFTDQLIRDLTSLGGLTFTTLLLILILIYNQITLFIHLLFGVLVTLIIVIIIRLIYFRDRPNKQEYTNILEKIDASSFPSLHAARILFICLTISYFFKNKDQSLYLTIFFLTVALLVIYSRYYLKKHDFYDLLFGSILGMLTFLLSLIVF